MPCVYAQSTPPSPTPQSVEETPQSVLIGPPDDNKEFRVLSAANTLRAKGKSPFHLKLTFQSFDLSGKPGEVGTLEYWWAGEDAGTRLDISSPSIGAVHSVDTQQVPKVNGKRILYLTGQLLDTLLSPASVLGRPDAKLETEDQMEGTVLLSCTHDVSPPGPFAQARTEVCSDAQTGTIRLIRNYTFTLVRNRPAKFAGTLTVLDELAYYSGKQAMTVHVEQLESFQPSSSTVDLQKPGPADTTNASTPATVRVSGGVLAGSKVGGPQPQYPLSARQQRIQGTVVLAALISKDGVITSLFPISSPDQSLADAAQEAVSKWRYKPYLLNGSPVEVNTTVTVNFNLNH